MCAGNQSLVVVSMAMVVIPFLPATNILFYVGFVLAERVLYIPSMGYCLLIGLGLRRLSMATKSSFHKVCIIFITQLYACGVLSVSCSLFLSSLHCFLVFFFFFFVVMLAFSFWYPPNFPFFLSFFFICKRVFRLCRAWQIFVTVISR